MDALLRLREYDTRISRLEGLVDHCIADMAECRIRIMELQVRRGALLGTLLPHIAITVKPPDAET